MKEHTAMKNQKKTPRKKATAKGKSDPLSTAKAKVKDKQGLASLDDPVTEEERRELASSEDSTTTGNWKEIPEKERRKQLARVKKRAAHAKERKRLKKCGLQPTPEMKNAPSAKEPIRIEHLKQPNRNLAAMKTYWSRHDAAFYLLDLQPPGPAVSISERANLWWTDTGTPTALFNVFSDIGRAIEKGEIEYVKNEDEIDHLLKPRDIIGWALRHWYDVHKTYAKLSKRVAGLLVKRTKKIHRVQEKEIKKIRSLETAVIEAIERYPEECTGQRGKFTSQNIYHVITGAFVHDAESGPTIWDKHLSQFDQPKEDPGGWFRDITSIRVRLKP